MGKKAKGPIEIGPLFTNLIWFCNPQRKHLVYQAQAVYPWGWIINAACAALLYMRKKIIHKYRKIIIQHLISFAAGSPAETVLQVPAPRKPVTVPTLYSGYQPCAQHRKEN